MGIKWLDSGVNAVKFNVITLKVDGTINLLPNLFKFASFKNSATYILSNILLAKHLTAFRILKVYKSRRKHYLNLYATIVAYGR